MSYQVIARKWRPQGFDEVTGQEHITRTLRNAIEHDRLHHAYLFSGARGVGKTTTARLLAKALNCHKADKPTVTPCRADDPNAHAPDLDRGRVALHQYACPTCHEIPGIVGADNAVGPSLDGLAARGYLAGVLPNTPANLVAWLRDPPAVVPGTAMPSLGVTERDARDMVAYLSTLR